MKHIKFTMWLGVSIYSAGLCLYNCEEIEWPSNLVNIVFFVNFNSDWIKLYVNNENVENVYTCNFSVGQSTSFLHFFYFGKWNVSVQAQKIKKIHPKKISYTLILRKWLYFLKMILFLYFRKLLIFSEENFKFLFQETEASKKIPYVSGNGTFLRFRRNLQILEKTNKNVCSEELFCLLRLFYNLCSCKVSTRKFTLKQIDQSLKFE